MIAGIELGKQYAQISVKTELMKEPESVTMIAGAEQYRIPAEADLQNKEELQELFRKLWKLVLPYGDREPLEYLVFCLEECTEPLRKLLLEITENFDISHEKVKFVDKKEAFCTYVLHQSPELLARNALLIENKDGEKEHYLLHKKAGPSPAITRVYELSSKTLEQIFKEYGISSVFLVGDDFTEEWMEKNLRILKSGRRVFAGKNLFVKGACYRGMELKEECDSSLYLGEEKICFDIMLKSECNGKETLIPVVKGGKNWYESDVSVDLLLLDSPELEFELLPVGGGQKKNILIQLKDLPKRPEKTTKIRLELEFVHSCCGKVTIRDLGFGELFPASDMKYEGELRWEQ